MAKHNREPAAFRRLCVETDELSTAIEEEQPAAFRRLCVETRLTKWIWLPANQPPSGGCVLKHRHQMKNHHRKTSRLQAAVC